MTLLERAIEQILSSLPSLSLPPDQPGPMILSINQTNQSSYLISEADDTVHHINQTNQSSYLISEADDTVRHAAYFSRVVLEIRRVNLYVKALSHRFVWTCLYQGQHLIPDGV